MAELKSVTFSMSYGLQMPALDPPAAATNMGFILSACFCTSLLLRLPGMSQVPVTEMKDPGSLQRQPEEDVPGYKMLSEKHLQSTASSQLMAVPAWVSCVLYLCVLQPLPRSWRPSVLAPCMSLPHSLLSAAHLLFVRETVTKTLKGWSESRGKNANSYFSSLASIFVVKETENKSYLL